MRTKISIPIDHMHKRPTEMVRAFSRALDNVNVPNPLKDFKCDLSALSITKQDEKLCNMMKARFKELARALSNIKLPSNIFLNIPNEK